MTTYTVMTASISVLDAPLVGLANVGSVQVKLWVPAEIEGSIQPTIKFNNGISYVN